jgi:hypothetical protein
MTSKQINKPNSTPSETGLVGDSGRLGGLVIDVIRETCDISPEKNFTIRSYKIIEINSITRTSVFVLYFSK